MGLDDNLLSGNTSNPESSSSGDEAAVSESSSEQSPSSGPAPSQGAAPAGATAANQPKSLREAVRMEKAKKISAEKKLGEAAQKPNPMRMAVSSLLRSAWMNLLPTLGLTLLWIDAHVFLRQILGKSLFCKLGEEWTDKPGMQAQAAAKSKEANMLTIVEPLGAACCNFGCLLILLIVLAIVAMIAGVADFLAELVKDWFKGWFSWW